MEFKKQYTKEEVQELTSWMENHKDQFPLEFDLDKATHLNNLPQMVHFYNEVALLHVDNPTYSGQIYFLFRLRDALREACHIAD